MAEAQKVVHLLELGLQNFKGISSFVLTPEGKSQEIRGQNGAGKTTLLDAWCWLWTGKNSQGQADFNIKTLDEDGLALSNLDHMVWARVSIDGKQRTYTKVFREEWRKPRGQPRPTFRGHQTHTYMDGEKITKKKEWEQAISEVADEATLRLLSHHHFAQMNWKERRKILIEMCGDVSAEEVVETNPKLQKVPELLGEVSADQKRKTLDEKRKELERERESIPSKIEELERQLPSTDETREDQQQQIKSLEERLQQIKSQGVDPEIEKEERELREELNGLQLGEKNAAMNESDRLHQEIRELEKDQDKDADKLHQLKKERESLESSIQQANSELERLRNLYNEIRHQDPGNNVSGHCPTCGQPLPEDQFDKAIKKAKDAQAEELKKITEQGKEQKSKLSQCHERLQALEKEQSEVGQHHDERARDIKKLEEQKQAIESGRDRSFLAEGHDKRISDIQARLEEIGKIKMDSGDSAPDTSEIEQELEQKRQRLAQLDAAKETKDRIEELKQQEKQKNQEYEEVQEKLALLNEFENAKAKKLEDRVSSYFDLVQFRLFERQVDGGIKPDCEILVDGVPYSTGLNKGGRILANLDVTKALSKHYGVWLPLFIDDMEGLTNPAEYPHQTISLIAAPGVAKLDVKEVENG